MIYIYQLGNGKMLCMNDENKVEVIETCYPYPDCAIKLGDHIIKDQNQILKAILGYAITDFNSFATQMLEIEPMPFRDWKLKVQSENIGGGCPLNSQRFATYLLEGCTENQAFYKLLIPNGNFKENCKLPTDDWLEENKSYFAYGFNTEVIDNKIIYSHLTDLSIDFLDILSDALLNCYSAEIPRYITIVEGYKVGIILFSDDIANNEDLRYAYCKAMNISEEDFTLTINTFGSNVNIKYTPITKNGQKIHSEDLISDFFGSFQRFVFKDGVLDYYKED